MFVKEHQKDGLRFCSAEKDLPKVKSTAVSVLWILSWVAFEFLQISGM